MGTTVGERTEKQAPARLAFGPAAFLPAFSYTGPVNVFCRFTLVVAFFAWSASAFGQSEATAASGGALEFRFTPTARAQVAIWVEKADGTFMDTVGLTQSVSLYGIGNRPGAAQMNSGFRWPYGRREGVLPIWAHRRMAQTGAQMFRRVIFQNRDSEGFASRTSNDSSPDPYYCLSFSQGSSPAQRKQDFVDAVTCASANRFMSDKGRFITEADVAAAYSEPAVVDGVGIMRALGLTSLYPPRRDLGAACGTHVCGADDTADSLTYGDHVRQVIPNIDTVTMATPAPDRENVVMFSVPGSWADGDYLAWVEVNVEGDYNATFNDRRCPRPTQPATKWDSWAVGSGYPYRGQPSVVYQIPFKLGSVRGRRRRGGGPLVLQRRRCLRSSTGGQLHPLDQRITDDPVARPGAGRRPPPLDRSHWQPRPGHGPRPRCLRRHHHSRTGGADGLAAAPGTEKKNSHRWGELHFLAPSSTAPIAQYQVRFSPAKSAPIMVGDQGSFDRASPAVAAKDDPQAVTVPVTGQAGK